ncbi:MAG: hypothetical protein Q7U66_06455 [Methylobacter sp.]|nr:hypothetical protein [Methylobacter sp.]
MMNSSKLVGKYFAKFHSVMSTKSLSENNETSTIQNALLSFTISNDTDQPFKSEDDLLDCLTYFAGADIENA